MKHLKHILFTLLLMTVSVSSWGATTKSDAESFKSTIMNFLGEEGYTPRIDQDEDIVFKYQGEDYNIIVDPYSDGYYVCLLSLIDLNALDIGQVLVALDQTESSLKFVRCYTIDEYKFATIQVSLYCENIKDFARMFINSMDIITLANTRLIENMVNLMND